jgi:hypothetical protein
MGTTSNTAKDRVKKNWPRAFCYRQGSHQGGMYVIVLGPEKPSAFHHTSSHGAWSLAAKELGL